MLNCYFICMQYRIHETMIRVQFRCIKNTNLTIRHFLKNILIEFFSHEAKFIDIQRR